MDEGKRYLLIEKRKKLNINNFFKKFETISLIGFEEIDSIWYSRFYEQLNKFNCIYSTPNFTKTCCLMENEMIKWALEHLSDFNDETKFLLPVQGYLANIEVRSFSGAIQELWRPYSNIGVSITMASKDKKKIFHVFEDEYEYQLYIDEI